MTQITKQHLDFVQEAKEVFEAAPLLETYRNDDDTLIALRMGMDRDCVEVWELGNKIANFVQQMDPYPMPRKVVREFSYDMEKQLEANENKGGWKEADFEYLQRHLRINANKLNHALSKADKDKHEITIRCTNIANYAMMIADNEGEHL